MTFEDDIIEKLAELEHIQWEEWSKNLWSELNNIRRDLNEAGDINAAVHRINERFHRWEKNWIPYKDLPENVKEHDRKWARKVIEIIKKGENP